MKMQTLFKASALSLVAVIALWSCKDDFTEEDLLDKQASLGQDSIDFSVLVYNASTSFAGSGEGEEPCIDCGRNLSNARTKGVASLIVTISKNGKTVTDTTDASGIALFKGLQPGTIVGTVIGDGFTTTNFTVSIKEGESSNSDNEPTTNAGAIIPVFETEGDNVATVTGRATFEGTLLNDEPEPVPAGTKIAFSIDASSDSFNDLFKTILDLDLLGESVTSASVDNLSFSFGEDEGDFVAVVGANGNYIINLPTSHHGLDYTYTFSDFTVGQSIAINNYENRPFGELRQVEVISTQFSQNNTPTFGPRVDIPFINPVQIFIGEPPAAGTGASVVAGLLPAPIATSFTVLSSGAGYPASSTTINVNVSGGDFFGTLPATLVATSDAQGRITSVAVSNTPAGGYKSQVTLSIPGGAIPAVVRANYQSTVVPLFSNAATAGTAGTTLTGGTNYAVAPEILFKGRDFAGNDVVASATDVVVSGGAVVSFTVPTTSFATVPTVTVLPQQRITATAVVSGVNDVTGSISSVSLFDGGSGYSASTPPLVEVRHLRAGGTGAIIQPVVSASGAVAGVQLVNAGSGYSFLNNANFPTFRQAFRVEGNGTLTLRAGATHILNAYYGTGVRTRGTDTND
jgi:hypothetical protein